MRTTHLFVLAILFTASCTGEKKEKEQSLVWSDEFDTDGLADSNRWNYELGMLRNNELQYYTKANSNNARTENGMLIIEARKDSIDTARFSSASLITKGKKEFLYGRVEVRAKVPEGRGTWPAAWMLGTSIDTVDWPACGEIDIMENVGFDPDRIHGNVHTEAYNHVKKTNKGNNILVQDPSENFHVYAIEWRHNRIDFFVDETKYFTFEKESDNSDVWPFDKPHYLILNLAVGGGWGGQQGIDESRFPHRYVVDYVRVYDLE